MKSYYHAKWPPGKDSATARERQSMGAFDDARIKLKQLYPSISAGLIPRSLLRQEAL
jgi:hypothetical protein